jgi:septal ring factor EnvC (AmiA/AmiB activator)
MSEKIATHSDVELISTIQRENQQLKKTLDKYHKLIEELRREIDYYRKRFEDLQENQRREFESKIDSLGKQIDSLRDREDARSRAHWGWIYSEKDRVFKDRERILEQKAEMFRLEREEFLKLKKASEN